MEREVMNRDIKIGQYVIPLRLITVLLFCGICVGALVDYILRITVYHSEEILTVTSSNVCREVWAGFKNDSVGNSSFVDGKVRIWINDTSGSWGLAKIGRGQMPHYWGVRYALLDNEIEISNVSAPEVKLDIRLRLVEYHNYTNTNSSMNMAICFFFDGNITDYQQTCYQTEIQFFSYFGDRIQNDQAWYFLVWRNDGVAQFRLADNLKKGEIKRYEINVTPFIMNMVNHYGLPRAKLRHIEIFTEAYKGYCEFELYDCKIVLLERTPKKTHAFNYYYRDPILTATECNSRCPDFLFISSKLRRLCFFIDQGFNSLPLTHSYSWNLNCGFEVLVQPIC